MIGDRATMEAQRMAGGKIITITVVIMIRLHDYSLSGSCLVVNKGAVKGAARCIASEGRFWWERIGLSVCY